MTNHTQDPRPHGAQLAFMELIAQPQTLDSLIAAQRKVEPRMDTSQALSYVVSMIRELIELGCLIVTDGDGNQVTFPKMSLSPLDRETAYTFTRIPWESAATRTSLELPDPSALY